MSVPDESDGVSQWAVPRRDAVADRPRHRLLPSSRPAVQGLHRGKGLVGEGLAVDASLTRADANEQRSGEASVALDLDNLWMPALH